MNNIGSRMDDEVSPELDTQECNMDNLIMACTNFVVFDKFLSENLTTKYWIDGF